jgi:hypothetical protein
MKGYVQDIGSIANGNNGFRRVLRTARHIQPVVVSLKLQEDIGAVVHRTQAEAEADTGHGDDQAAE